MTEPYKSPHEPWHETAERVCQWHAKHGDVVWAKRYLEGLLSEALITEKEAAVIRERCGWVIQRTLL